MSVATETTTYVAEYSYEATTLDYLSPRWYPYEGVEPFADEAEAQAFVAAKYAEQQAAFEAKGSVEPVAFRVRKVQPVTYVDSDAEFYASYWREQARAARMQEEAKQEMFRSYGRGNTVRVVKGRKVPVGTKGEVFWLGEDKYGNGYRVGFQTPAGEKHFTSLANVEAVAS